MPQIDELLRSFSQSTKPNEKFFSVCRNFVLQSKYVFCPEQSGKLVGIGYIVTPFGIPNLGMAVAHEQQGQGIGNSIMENVLTYTAEQHSILVSCIWKSNNPIIKLHRKYGFELIRSGTKVNWYAWSRDWKARKWLLALLLLPYDYIVYQALGKKVEG